MPKENFVETRSSQVQGRGLFATKDILAGSLIVSKSKPLVGVLDTPRLPDTCSNCFAWTADSTIDTQEDDQKAEVKACSQCKLLKFCGKTCQAQAWRRFHKFECQQITRSIAAGQRDMPNAVRATIQLLAMRKNGKISEAGWLEVLKLQSHLDHVKASSPNRKVEVELLSKGALTLSLSRSIFAPDFAQHIFTMVLTNALTLTTSAFDPLGIIVDPLACTANHSCDPNAVVVFDGPAFAFRALKPIKKDEEIFTSYIDNTNPFARRQHELKERYHFTCQCSKCVKGPTLSEDAWSKPISELPADLKETCRNVAMRNKGFESDPATFVGNDADGKAMTVLQRRVFEDLEMARRAETAEEAIGLYKKGIETCTQSTMYPLTRQPYPALTYELMVNLLSTGNYPNAWMQGVKTYLLIDPVLYPEPHHPLRVVHNWTLAMLTLFLSVEPDPRGAVEQLMGSGIDFGVIVYALLSEVLANVDKSHGKDSSFARMVKRKVDEVKTDMTRGDPERLMRIEMEGLVEEQWKQLRRQM